MRIRRYLFSDVYRLWFSGKMIMGIFLTYMAIMLNSFLWGHSNDVLLLFFGIRTFSTIVITYIGAAFCFGTSLLEDMEHRYVFQGIIRGNIWEYTVSKVTVCFSSALICYVCGYLLFVFTYSFLYPLCEPSSPITEFYIQNDMFGIFIRDGHYILFYLFSAMLTGMLAGLLAVSAMYLSLFTDSRIIVLSAPMMLHYFIENYIANWLKLPVPFRPVLVFNSEVGAFNNNPLAFIYAFMISVLLLCLFIILIKRQIERGL